jgi:membrane-bound lytic murein transglycosylase D
MVSRRLAFCARRPGCGVMERIGPRLRQRAVFRLLCLWLVACAWTGCAAKGGAKPWEGIFSSRALKGQEPGGQGAQEEGSPAGEPQWDQEGLWGGSSQELWEPSPQQSGWPEVDLDPSWRRAFQRSPVLGLDGLDHPAVQGFAQDLRLRGESSGGRLISRSSKFIPRMKEIFREEGLPEELVYLAFVESGFNPWSSSAGKCVGIWQFTEATGRRYGLRIDSWVDERRDPEKSTRAAARYLRDLFQTFRSWDLAIAAYNAGEAAISNSLEKKEATSFWELYPSGGLSKATREFVPKVMAAILVAQEEQAGFPGTGLEQELWRFDKVRIQEHMELGTVARLAGCTEKELRSLNPQIKGSVLHPGASGLDIRVPEGKGEEIKALLSEKGQMVRFAQHGESPPVGFRSHKVRPGDTLEGIARQYGTTAEEIRRWNTLRAGGRLSPGTDLLVPEGKPRHARSEGASRVKDSKDRGSPSPATLHKVQKGETLWSIARLYGVSVDDLMRWNNMRGSLLQPGTTLRINP